MGKQESMDDWFQTAKDMAKAEKELKTSMRELILEKKPVLEFCGTPPDGRANRRERRKQERLARKKKLL